MPRRRKLSGGGTFQNRKIRTGPRGGKYILKGGKKHYLSGGFFHSTLRKKSKSMLRKLSQRMYRKSMETKKITYTFFKEKKGAEIIMGTLVHPSSGKPKLTIRRHDTKHGPGTYSIKFSYYNRLVGKRKTIKLNPSHPYANNVYFKKKNLTLTAKNIQYGTRVGDLVIHFKTESVYKQVKEFLKYKVEESGPGTMYRDDKGNLKFKDI